MSTIKTNNVQLGQSLTATNNFTWYQPASPDGTVRLGNGNAGSVTDLITVGSTGNLGIGTSSPSFPSGTGLAVYNSTVPRIKLTNSTTGDTATDGTQLLVSGSDFYIQQREAASVIISTNGSDRVTVDASGNLGLGVTPSVRLNVQAATANATVANFSGANSGRGLTIKTFQSVGGDDCGVDFSAFASPYGSFKWTQSASTVMTLDASGNLGIGTTTIGSRLTVGDPGTGMTFTNAASGNFNIGLLGGTGATDAYIYQRANAALIFATNNTERARIDSSGNLLVGTTSQIGAVTARGVFSSTGNLFSLQAGNGYVGAYMTNTSGTASWQPFSFCNNGSSFSQIGSITCTASATVYNTISDQRLKTNITPAGSAIQSILDFPVDQFDWISSGEHQDFGAVAQKAINFIPEMVSVSANEDEMWGIDWSKAVPRLIKTIQEMHEEIETLKQKVNA